MKYIEIPVRTVFDDKTPSDFNTVRDNIRIIMNMNVSYDIKNHLMKWYHNISPSDEPLNYTSLMTEFVIEMTAYEFNMMVLDIDEIYKKANNEM